MKSIRAIPFASLLIFASAATADIFILKDGTELEGTVLSEEGDNYLLEIQVTKSIKDERLVAKTDVERIVRVKEDEVALAKLTELVPVPDLQPTAEYDKRIAAVDAFLKQFPKSARLNEAKSLHKQLVEERDVVAAGGMKMNGLMVQSADYQANAFELDARVLEGRIRDHAARSEWLGALRAFAALDAEFRTTVPYREVLPVVGPMLRMAQSEVVGSLTTLDSRLKQREAGLTRMSVDDRARTEAAIKEEAVAIEARYQAEKKAGVAWVTPSLFHKASLEDCKRRVETDLKRLTETPPEGDGGKVFRDAWAAIQGAADAKAAQEALSQAKSANIPQRYISMLEAAVKPAAANP
jgi:hypothetical protein